VHASALPTLRLSAKRSSSIRLLEFRALAELSKASFPRGGLGHLPLYLPNSRETRRHPRTARRDRTSGSPNSPPPACATPTTKPDRDGEPTEQVAARDTRGHSQRQHDASAPWCVASWATPSWAPTAACPSPSSPPPPSKTCKPRPTRRHRRRHPAPDVGSDPDGRPRLPVPSPVRRHHRPPALPRPHQNTSHPPINDLCCTPMKVSIMR